MFFFSENLLVFSGHAGAMVLMLTSSKGPRRCQRDAMMKDRVALKVDFSILPCLDSISRCLDFLDIQ